jgi:hypothetical protein
MIATMIARRAVAMTTILHVSACMLCRRLYFAFSHPSSKHVLASVGSTHVFRMHGWFLLGMCRAMNPSGTSTNSTCGGFSTGEPFREVMNCMF